MASKRGIIEVPTSMYQSERAKIEAEGWVVVHNPVIKASHVVVREQDEQRISGRTVRRQRSGDPA